MQIVRRLVLILLVTLALGVGWGSLRAQGRDDKLSEAEVDKLRSAAYVPVDRIAVFIKILDSRSKSIETLVSKPRKPGRELDLHDLFDQFSGIADELNDNLDDYAPKHRDLRKALPKLIEATERWATTLRSAAENPAYKVVQKIALDSVRDVHDAAVAMQTEQVAFFTAHPEAAEADRARMSNEVPKQETIEIPR